MTIISGVLIIFAMLMVLGLLETFFPTTVQGELNIVVLIIFAFTVMYVWGLNERVVTDVFDAQYRAGFFSRAIQVIHSILAVIIVIRASVLIYVGGFLVLAWLFVKWLIWG